MLDIVEVVTDTCMSHVRQIHTYMYILRPSGLCLGLPGWADTRTNLDYTEARDSEWQWHELGHMQICTSSQTDYMPAPHHSVFYSPYALPDTQPTASENWKQSCKSDVWDFCGGCPYKL